MKHLVVGNKGEVGSALQEIFIESNLKVDGIDIYNKNVSIKPDVLHICIPFSNEFNKTVFEYSKKFYPGYIIIHSTVSPCTTNFIIGSLKETVLYSPVRGQHGNLKRDMLRYPKYFSPYLPKNLEEDMRKVFKEIVIVENTMELELAKLLDTTQYGILIAWAQEAERFCKRYGVSHNLVRDFGKKTNEFYGLKPDISPGFCGGKCVRQNIAILNKIRKSKFLDCFIESNMQKGIELGIVDEVNYG